MPHWFKSKWPGKRQSIIFDLLGSGRSFKHWFQLTFTRGPIFGKCLRFFRARIIIIVKFNNPFRPQNGGSFILMVRIYRCSNACNSQELQLLYSKISQALARALLAQGPGSQSRWHFGPEIKYSTENVKNEAWIMFKFCKIIDLHQPLCCMSEGILRFIISISSYYVFLVLIIIFLSKIFILYQILRKQNNT